MARTVRFTFALLVAIAALLIGAFLTAPVPAPAAPAYLTDTTVPVPSAPLDPTDHSTDSDGPSDGGGEAQDSPADARVLTVEEDDSQADSDAVRSDSQAGADDSQADSDAVRSDSQAGAGEPSEDGAEPATDDDQDGTDPDALPADAPRVCVILDMGASACESFVHPAPGEVSVAVIYSDDDEHAIVETIAYDEHGPIDYVDFWEGETTPSE